MIKIIGAGMAGLMAGNMLRDRNISIIEEAAELPNNHSAVLRFRSSIVGDALNIPFEKVSMMKSIHYWRNPVADNLAYALKCTGVATLRSIITAEPALVERYIAPDDLIKRMSEKIEFKLTFNAPFTKKKDSEIIISTIPMPLLMKILNYPVPSFVVINGININCRLSNVSAFASLYIPDPDVPFSRISLTGNRMTIEIPLPGKSAKDIKEGIEILISNPNDASNLINSAMERFGIESNIINNVTISSQRYAKILPINEEERKKFIVWATTNHNIYSLGRYAVWRPTLLLDDIVNDVRVIARLIDGGSDYDHRKK